MQNSIQSSVFHLAKSNNGFWKSEKQAAFLIGQFTQSEGCVGHADSGYNSCPIFVEWDADGITKIWKHSKTKKGYVNKTMFTRKVEGVLTELEIKAIKQLERKLKEVQKSYDERIERFNNGTYFKAQTPSDFNLRLYESSKQRDADFIAKLQKSIEEIKNR
jgi:hypothetical protein